MSIECPHGAGVTFKGCPFCKIDELRHYEEDALGIQMLRERAEVAEQRITKAEELLRDMSWANMPKAWVERVTAWFADEQACEPGHCICPSTTNGAGRINVTYCPLHPPTHEHFSEQGQTR